MRAQLAMTLPQRRRLHQYIVQTKIANQSVVLEKIGKDKTAERLLKISEHIQPGDAGNNEGKAANFYFKELFDPKFTRKQERFHNAALNYGYAVVRATIARSLVSYGFLLAFGLFHHNEQNAFNLADDLIEPYRPFVDLHVIQSLPIETERDLQPADKGTLVSILHTDVHLTGNSKGKRTLLAAIDATVQSLSRITVQKKAGEILTLPTFSSTKPKKSATKKR